MSQPARTSYARSIPRFAEDAVERARLSVVPRTRIRARAARIPFVVLVTLLLVGGVVGLLFFNTSMQQSSFTASRLQDQADALQARQQALEMELERLGDPQVIARKAQRMHMVIPNVPLFLDLRTGRTEGDRAAAAAGARVALDPAPPVKPAALNPPAQVEIVRPPEGTLPEQRAAKTKKNKSDRDTASGTADRRSTAGRNGARR